MVRGLYTAYTGMINEQNRLDTVTNNLANASTIGYKKEGSTNQAFDDVLTIKVRDASVGFSNQAIGTMSLGVKIGENYTDYTQGSLRETGNTYDLALEGKGFFVLSHVNESGQEKDYYTRDGSFKKASDGSVMDAYGNRVRSESGYLVVPADSTSITIDGQGGVYADGEYIDRILVRDFEDYDYLQKYADNMYDAVDGATQIEPTAQINQGFTEQSNVNVVTEMVQMINITRAYEANQKVIKTVDTMLDAAVNSVGKV